MRDDQNRSFFGEFLKWFAIWNIIALLCKAFVYMCKFIIIGIQQTIYLICIGIAKISPILKAKFTEFSNNYATTYKPKMKKKEDELFESFGNLKTNIVSKFSNLKLKKKPKDKNKKIFNTSTKKTRTQKAKKPKNTIKNKESGVMLHFKKVRFEILEFYYKYELQIIILIIIIAVIVAIILGVTFFKK